MNIFGFWRTGLPSSRPEKRGFTLLAVIIVTTAAVILTASFGLSARSTNPHDFQTVGCTHCHLIVPGQSTIVQKKVFRRDISELCLECHKDSAGNSVNHRVGIVPSMKVPDDLHLSPEGEMNCITCHMPHLPYKDKRTGGRTYYLRRGILKRELCLACHYEEKFEEPTSNMEVIAPVDNSIVKRTPVPLIGIISDDLVKEVTLSINGVPLRLSVQNKAFSTLLTLQEGVNKLKIEARNARTLNLTLLHSPDLPDDVTYKLYHSHGILKKEDCRLCHTDEGTYSISIPDEVLCAKCHETKNAEKYLHGPVAAGSCTVCHDPHGQTNRFFLVGENERLCFNCHTEQEVLLHFIDKSKENLKILKTRGCNFCHNPHQSQMKYLLRKS